MLTPAMRKLLSLLIGGPVKNKDSIAGAELRLLLEMDRRSIWRLRTMELRLTKAVCRATYRDRQSSQATQEEFVKD